VVYIFIYLFISPVLYIFIYTIVYIFITKYKSKGTHTVNGESFPGLNFHGFDPMEVFY